MPTSRVFAIDSSCEEDRPMIDFDASEDDYGVDWLYLRNKRRKDRDKPLEIAIDGPNPTEWDFYLCDDTMGLMSMKAIDVLENAIEKRFKRIPATIAGVPYAILLVRETLDCLDASGSKLVKFPHDPTTIKWIEHYEFHLDRIDEPSLFCIPNAIIYLFGTEGVAKLIEKHGLKGFRLRDTKTLFEPVYR